MKIVTLLFSLIILFFGISFSVLNANRVPFHYYYGVSTMPLSFLLVIVLIVGVFIGLLVSMLMLIKAKTRNIQVKKKLSSANKEIKNLRNIPLEDRE